jgi:hypothetical protein
MEFFNLIICLTNKKTHIRIAQMHIQLLKKVLDHPVFVSYNDFIQKTPLERQTFAKLIYDRQLCLLYPMVVLESNKCENLGFKSERYVYFKKREIDIDFVFYSYCVLNIVCHTQQIENEKQIRYWKCNS